MNDYMHRLISEIAPRQPVVMVIVDIIAVSQVTSRIACKPAFIVS